MNSVLSHRQSLSLAFFAGGALVGTGIALWLDRRARNDAQKCSPAAAFAGDGAHPKSPNHTRDAGPEHIRDEDGTNWDALDQSSDESFPSSDPPAANNFSTPKPIDYSKSAA